MKAGKKPKQGGGAKAQQQQMAQLQAIQREMEKIEIFHLK